MRPRTLTSVTGIIFFAVLRSSCGISTLSVAKAEAWRRMTASTSWLNKNNSGNSGEELRTALLL